MNLSEFLSQRRRPILLDGAMGTQLAEAGLEMGGQNCLSHPDAVLGIHRQYADCGVDLLITNTLTMNRVYIESHRAGVDTREVNLGGVRLAKAAAHAGQYVLGDISSTGRTLEPYGDLSTADACAAFREQAAILAEGGVDGFIIETMFDLQEALCALRACREVSDLPVIASMAFNTTKRGGRTIMGNSARDCAQALAEAGACAVGANCGALDPFEMAEVVSNMRAATSLPLLAQPNAGRPRLVGDRTVFDMSPADFAEGMRQCLQAGAQWIGGCCGTSPAHIRAMVELRPTSSEFAHPTPYADVNAVLDTLLSGVRTALEDQFVGLYLYGSLAGGDFDPQTSDVDFVVVTTGELRDDQIAALAALHARITASGSKWSAKLEGSYIPRGVLRRYVPADTPRPTLNEGRFYLTPHGSDWVFQRHVLREQGVVVAGPPPDTMIDPVGPDDLRRAVVGMLQEWWAPMINEPARLRSSEYQAYAILSMCRALHTLEHGVIASKPVAAKWAGRELGRRWATVIERALAWRRGMELDYFQEALDLIRYTVSAIPMEAGQA